MRITIKAFSMAHSSVEFEPITLGQAWAQILKENSGLRCPHGCKGCAVRVFGLVRHLMEKHNYSEKAAWRKAHEDNN